MATLAALKKKIADLEAQVEKVTKAEMGAAITKVRKIMADFGLTVEHLAEGATAAKAAGKKRASAKTVKTATKAKGSKPAKYRDPATGVTWAGVGRAPAWIANAKNRDEFLIAKPAAGAAKEEALTPAKKPAKRAAPAKRAKVAVAAKKAARKVEGAAKRVAKAANPKAGTKKSAVKKAASKKTAAKKVVAKAPRKKSVSKSAAAPAATSGTSAEASST